MTYAYKLLAEHYDDFFDSFRDPLIAARREILKPILPHIQSACDLCCGTGTTAIDFARLGLRAYGVDLSPGMCRLTREKARRVGRRVRVVRGDMRSFRLPEPVDLITCEFDAINHVPRREDLARVAKAAARALAPGGWFYFDANNAAGFKRYWTGNMWCEKPGVAMVMRNAHSPSGEKAWSDLEWFIRNGRRWQRYHERVVEVSWKAKEVRSALRDAGFDRIRASDAMPYFAGVPVMAPGCRTIWLARLGRL